MKERPDGKLSLWTGWTGWVTKRHIICSAKLDNKMPKMYKIMS